MTLTRHQRVVLAQDLPEEGFRAGDVGVIVEHCPARADAPRATNSRCSRRMARQSPSSRFRRPPSGKRPSTRF
jgi:hypothetical protein